MDEFDDSNGTSSLIASLAANATSAYETTAALNANPLNTAIVYGGTATTAQGTTASATPSSIGAIGSSGTVLLVIAVAAIAFFALR